MVFFTVFPLTFLLVSAVPYNDNKIEDGCTVTDYNQVSDAIASCSELIIDGITVPAGTTLNLVLRDSAKLTLQGHIQFEYAEWEGPLVLISGKNIEVQQADGSYFDGNGQSYWDSLGNGGKTKPLFFDISNTTVGSELTNIKLKNCPLICTKITGSDSLTLNGWSIDIQDGNFDVAELGKSSFNTNGFVISNTTNLVIENATVFNQDDCITVNQGSNLRFNNIFCNGSYGLSLEVGLDAIDGTKNTVSDVLFSNSTVVDGLYGIHIASWPFGAAGYIKNITFENIVFSGIHVYGIRIEQNKFSTTAVANIPISNLRLTNVQGTIEGSSPYSKDVAIVCADGGCSDWTWTNVSVTGGLASDDCNFMPEGYVCKNVTTMKSTPSAA